MARARGRCTASRSAARVPHIVEPGRDGGAGPPTPRAERASPCARRRSGAPCRGAGASPSRLAAESSHKILRGDEPLTTLGPLTHGETMRERVKRVFRTRDENAKLIKKNLKGHRKIGVNASELTYATFQRLQKLAPPSARFVDVSQAVTKTRLVKDAQEIELIQRACDIASRAFEETLPFIRTGVTESEVASELVYRMQKNGATAPSFRTIVGSGPNGAEPHYSA